MVDLKDCIWSDENRPNGQKIWNFNFKNFKEYIEHNYKKYTSMKNLCIKENIPYNTIKRRCDAENGHFNRDDYAWKNHRYAENDVDTYMNGLIGVKFNNWVILDYIGNKQIKRRKYRMFKCLCTHCDKTISEIRYRDMILNKTYQCRSCHVAKVNRETKRKTNNFTIENNIVKVFYKSEYTIIDKKFKNEILDNRWSINGGGYFIGRIKNMDRNMSLHRYIMYLNGDLNIESNFIVDHINHNRLDNRLSNLRVATYSNNSSYKDYKKYDRIIGVHKSGGKWLANLYSVDIVKRDIFENKRDAIKQRLVWESEILKEFSPQKHLFEEYGVDIYE